MDKLKNAGIVILMGFMVAALVAACGGGGGYAAPPPLPPPGPTPVSLVNGQAATVVIGQASFTTNTAGITATTLNNPSTNVSVDPATGKLYIADSGNNRTLVYNSIPTTNGASAVFAVGQNDLVSAAGGTSATAVNSPLSPVVAGGQLFVADYTNNRVVIYTPTPTASPGTITTVVGQANKTSGALACSATGLSTPETVSVAGSKMVVADGSNNRVLIWNSIPATDGAAANVVLGQPDMTTCTANTGGVSASSISLASGAWTDGTRVVVLDQSNNRVLIWNTFPTTNNQPADLVLGQANFTTGTVGTTATTLNNPYEGVFVNAAGQLFVADSGNNRVLVWNNFPTSNGQAADVVLGQTNFTTGTAGTTATTLSFPTGVTVSGTHVLVTDSTNNRVLVY